MNVEMINLIQKTNLNIWFKWIKVENYKLKRLQKKLKPYKKKDTNITKFDDIIKYFSEMLFPENLRKICYNQIIIIIISNYNFLNYIFSWENIRNFLMLELAV